MCFAYCGRQSTQRHHAHKTNKTSSAVTLRMSGGRRGYLLQKPLGRPSRGAAVRSSRRRYLEKEEKPRERQFHQNLTRWLYLVLSNVCRRAVLLAFGADQRRLLMRSRAPKALSSTSSSTIEGMLRFITGYKDI